MRSRRSIVALAFASLALAGAGAPFAPRVYWRARVAWTARGLESANEDERWNARLALLELPHERIAPLIPRIVAGAAIDDGVMIEIFGPHREEEELLACDRNFPHSFRGSSSVARRQARDALSALARPKEHAYLAVFWSVDSDRTLGWDAPLDPDGETLRLLRERLPR